MQNADCGIRKGEKSLVFYSGIRIPKSELELSFCFRLPEIAFLVPWLIKNALPPFRGEGIFKS